MANATTCLDSFLRHVHPSLHELLVVSPDHLSDIEFQWDELPRLASTIVRLAGIAVSLEAIFAEPKQDSSPNRLLADLRRFLAGKAEGGDLFSISLLLEAAQECDPSTSRVSDVHAIADWRAILDARHNSLIRLENITQDVDLHQMFADLLQALPVLAETEWNRSTRCITVGKQTYLAFPFLISGDLDSDGLDLFAKNFRHLRTDQEFTIEEVLLGGAPRRIAMGSQFPRAELKHLDEVLSSLGVEGVQANIVHYFGTGYRHLADLSRAIANTRNIPQGNQALEWIFNHRKHRDMLSRLAPTFDDDEKLLLLFLEYGPEKVLTRLFEGNQAIASKLCDIYGDNLTKQCGIRGVDSWLQKARREQETQLTYLENLSISEDLLGSLTTRVTLEAEIWGLLSAAGFAHKDRINIGKSLSLREDTFLQLKREFERGKISAEKIIADGGKFLEATLRFLILLYHGLPGYHQSVQRYPGEESPEVHERRMLDAAEQLSETEEFTGATLGKLIEIFRRTIKSRKVQAATYKLLGRSEVCCLKTFNRLTSAIPKDRNDLIHYKPWVSKRENVERFIRDVPTLFCFLRTGSKTPDDERWYEDCVYPHVIGFKEARECRSGILIRAYELQELENRKQSSERIKILTPLRYPAADDYYCIPRTDKSSENYWLDPFIIPCDRFDAIVEPRLP